MLYLHIYIIIQRKYFLFNPIWNIVFIDKCFPRGTEICNNGGSCSVGFGGGVNCVCSNQHYGVRCENGMHYKAFQMTKIIML